MATGYLVNTGTSTNPVYTDLSDIFQPLGTGTPAAATGFTDANGNDLNTIFAPFILGCISAPKTNMKIANGQDLNQVFAPLGCTSQIKYTISNGTYFESYNSPWRGLVFYIPFGSVNANGMTGTISFNRDVSANIIVVGGGAGGGTYYTPNSTNQWGGCGGGGGATIIVPLILTNNTTYNLSVGQGGRGGATSNTTPIQSGGGASYFKKGTVLYTAGGGTVAAPLSTNGFQNSSGGIASINSGPAPSGFTAGGGGGGGGEINLRTKTQYGTGGTGGSYNATTNPGVKGGNAYYQDAQNGEARVGGNGGNSYFTKVSTPFNSTYSTTPVGGGGSATLNYTPDTKEAAFYSAFAGFGTGGAQQTEVNTKYTGWAPNANNNSYSSYTVSSGNSTTKGPTGLAGGYGAGGGGAVDAVNQSALKGCTGGVGGNGVVMIYWYEPNYVPTK